MKKKYSQLYELMKQYTQNDCVVAFSGGVDSSLLLKIACDEAKKNDTSVYAVTAHTRLHPQGDLECARDIAEKMGAHHVVVTIDELKEAKIEDNPRNRCYLCKKAIFCKILQVATEKKASIIIEGTNEDDLHVYRPGIQALKELGIKSPLAECKITKEEVRNLAKDLFISTADRPSMPCLATRIPYGDKISYEILEKIDQGERWLRSQGYYNVRLRVHGDIVRIEVDQSEIPRLVAQGKEVTDYIKRLGFLYITVDLEGFRSGSMDSKI